MKVEQAHLQFIKRILKKDDRAIVKFAFCISILATLSLLIIGSKAQSFNSGLSNISFYLFNFSIVIFVHYITLLYIYRPESPIRFIYQSSSIRNVLPDFVSSLAVVSSIAIFMPTFTAVKSAIPLFNTYSWDQTFIDWDMAIHGDDAWRVLQPFFGTPWITSIMSYVYHAWFLLIYIGPICVALYVRDRELRLRFFLGFLMTWTIVGMISAIIFASVGPAFLEPIVGNDHFREQMEYLHKAAETNTVLVLEVQRLLLEWYQAADYGLGRGITAMPSMHVALCVLYFLAMNQIDKRLGLIFLAFLILIMIGSVHLAYHYAVDGYVSIVATMVIWWATKPLAKLVMGSNRLSTRLDDAIAPSPAL